MLFQITVTGKVPVTAQKFEDTTKTEPVAVFLLQNGIDTNKSPPSQVAQQVADVLRKEQALPEDQRTFTKEWLRLTGIDLISLDALIREYQRLERLGELNMAKTLADARQAGRTATSAVSQLQDNQEYSDKLGKNEFNKFVRPSKVQPRNAA